MFMPTPTKYAAGGKIQSHGEDFSQYATSSGEISYWVDTAGIAWGSDFSTLTGISLIALNNQVQSLVVSGLPSVIDGGTF